MKDERSDQDWKRAQALGLSSGVNSREDYHEMLALNSLSTRESVLYQHQQNPGNSYIAGVHEILFQGVHPWAGQFRTLADPPTIVSGYPGADAGRIGKELDLLRVQFEELLLRRPDLGGIYLAIAFWHVRFERVHPFNDGNGRVGRALLDSQCHSLVQPVNRKSLVALGRHDYITALNLANRGKNLGLLATMIAQRDDPKLVIPPTISPFRVAPIFDDDDLTLDEELEKTRL